MKTIQRSLTTLAVLTAVLSTLHLAPAATVVWSGASTPDLNWSTTGNWFGGAVPTSADEVKFFDDGADPTLLNVNNVVNSLFAGTVLSLQYGQTNNTHTTLIEPGKTLIVLSNFIVGTEAIAAGNLDAAVTGAGGTLVVSNTATDFIVRQGGDTASRRATLDLSGLDTFILVCDQVIIGRGDPPGLANVNRNTGWVYLAKTNYIRSASASATPGTIGVEVGRSASNNGNGSRLHLGQTNTIFASSLSVGMEKETQCQLIFNPIFTSPVAYIRGSDGSSRMALWTIGDGEANSGTTSAQGTCDFTGGTVDARADAMTIGRASTDTGGTGNSRGTLTFNSGTINVNTLQVGLQTANTGKNGDGIVNVNGGTLIVNISLGLGQATGGAGVATTRGRLNINGGTVMANTIVAGAVTGGTAITNVNGTLILTNTAGSVGAALGNLSLSDSLLHLAAIGTATRVVVTNLSTAGAGNSIVIGQLPSITGYPVQFKLIDYEGVIGGSGYNFTMSGLSGSYTGFLSNNTTDTSVDLVITTGPVAQPITWNGNLSDDWDILTTKNWRLGVVGTNYFDGDFVTFNDAALGTTTVDLTTTVMPGSLTVNNSSLSYTFTGSGKLSGQSGLTKQGSGTLLVNNTGVNDFSGSIAISAGTVQVGNGGTGGNLGSGAISNNASLVFNRSDDLTANNVLSGTAAGTLTKNGGGVLTLGGANTFTGAVTVAQGTLRTGNASALGRTNGATIVSSGATLDVNALNLGAEPVTVSGTGVGGNGAIINSGAQQLNALRYVTLAGNTTFGNPGRWDIRGAPSTADPANAGLSTGGNPYSLTKIGTSTVGLVGVTVDPALGNIDVQAGTLGVEAATTGLGNPASNLIVRAGATLQFFNTTNLVNKQIILNGSGTNTTVNAGDGTSGLNFVVGPMALNGECWMSVNVADFMTFSNAITGGGGANLVKQGAGTLTLSGPAKTYSGNTTVSNGTLVLNCNLTGGGTLTTISNTTLAGTGTNVGPVIVGGQLSPGTSAGTFASGALTLNPGATLLFELNSVTTIGGGVNDLLQVNGNLTVNDNSFAFSLLNLTLQAGTYRLINYTGSLIGNLNTNVSLGGASRYSLTLSTNTAGQVNLIVGGSAGKLRWDSNASTTWDIVTTPNWLNLGSIVADGFYQGDSVLFDDTDFSGGGPVITTIDIPTGVVVVPSVVTNNSSINAFTINGPGRISGGTAIYKQGTSILIVNSTNDFTGVVTVEAGTLQIGNNSSLGTTAGGTTIKSGATLDIGAVGFAANTVDLGLEPIIVSGAGVSGTGAIVNNTATAQQNAVRVATMVGDTTFGGIGRWDFRGAGAALSTGGNAYNITKVGGNQVSLVGVTVDPALGDVDIQAGLFSIETTTTSGGAPNKTITVQSGATFQLHGLTTPLNKKLVLVGNGSANTFRNNNGANTLLGTVNISGDCIFSVVGTSLSVSNVISGTGNLIKNDGLPMSLNSVNTYSGDTTVNGGTLALIGPGSIATSPNITLAAAGSILDVGGRVDGTLTRGAGQTFNGIGTLRGTLMANAGAVVSPGIFGPGRLTVTNAAIFAASSTNYMEVDKSSFTNDVLSAGSITYAGTLQVVPLSLPFGAGDSFKLFNAGSYTGKFAAIDPPTPGAGLLWYTNDLTLNGTLRVKSATPLPPPHIASFIYTGFDVTINGTNGPAYGPYYIVGTTNLALPVASWSVLSTNYFDAGGNFSFYNLIDPAALQQFYLVKLP